MNISHTIYLSHVIFFSNNPNNAPVLWEVKKKKKTRLNIAQIPPRIQDPSKHKLAPVMQQTKKIVSLLSVGSNFV